MSNNSEYFRFARWRHEDDDSSPYDYEEHLHVSFHSSNSVELEGSILDGWIIGKSFLDQLVYTALPEAEVAVGAREEAVGEGEEEGEGSVRKDRRPASAILYPQMTKNKRSQCLRGPKSETQNMGKHLKSLTAAFLKVLINAKILTPQESTSASLFNKSNGGHSDFRELFRSGRLGSKCLEYFSSKDFVASIMRSPKMSMRNKLIMVRHLEVLRSASYKHLTSWKIQL